ncbi:class I adenylate-forming enzyme family protein [soil metagenome]
MRALPQRLVHDSLVVSAEVAPDREAIVDEYARRTYQELVDDALRVANLLQNEGLRRGDRVALYLDNTAYCAAAIFGTLIAGGVFIVLNPQTKADKLAFILADSGAGFLLSEGHSANVAGAAVSQRGLPTRVFATRASVAATPFPSLEQALAATDPRPVLPGTTPSDLAALVYTSGTTGRPKGVMLSHEALVFVIGSIAEYLRLDADDRILSILPLAYTYGLSQLLLATRLGGTLVLERTFAFPARTLERMHAERATVFGAVPTVYATLLGMKHDRTYDSVRCLTNAGAGLPPAFHDGIHRLFPEARLYRMYGQTECVRVSYLEPELVESKPTSVGRAIPGTEAFVLDDEGRPVAPGETGVLHVRGLHLMMGYWGDPASTEHRLKSSPSPGERILSTHDHFTVDEDGLLYFVGRTDDIIKTRGEKVSTVEVENLLHSLPGVRQAAVVGVPDDLLGEAVRAYVVLDQGAALTEDEILRFARSKLENFMVPREVVFLDELPHTESGKIRKRSLLEDGASLAGAESAGGTA